MEPGPDHGGGDEAGGAVYAGDLPGGVSGKGVSPPGSRLQAEKYKRKDQRTEGRGWKEED
jgi:hypothetical protein